MASSILLTINNCKIVLSTDQYQSDIAKVEPSIAALPPDPTMVTVLQCCRKMAADVRPLMRDARERLAKVKAAGIE